jgi:hypothetical protein
LSKQQRLYFFPLPHGQGSLRPGLLMQAGFHPRRILFPPRFSDNHDVNMAALFSILIALATASPTFSLALRLHAGERLVEHRFENDRVDWKLPQKRMEHFQKAGVVINEEVHLTSITHVVIGSVKAGIAKISGDVALTSFDVPRNVTMTVHRSFVTGLRSDNVPQVGGPLDVQDAAMTALPAKPLRLGQRWQTRARVMTTLGSGDAVFEHQIVAFENGLVRIAVSASGAITGAEYHLPKLLPGSIELRGEAWYDPGSGLITQESYAEHNQLLKPAEGEQIGFDERLTVDVSTRKL